MQFYLSWILLCVLAEVLILAVKFFLRKKEIKPKKRAILIAAKFLAAIASGTLVLAGPVFLRPIQPFLFALYAVLFADALADVVISIVCRISKKKRKTIVSVITGAVFAVLFVVYGTVNMETIKPSYHEFKSDKLTSEHKIVFIADLHVGSAQPFEKDEKMIEDIKAENPDLIILGGDITDDYTAKEEMENTFALFGNCGIPVYYVYGNHDRQGHAEYAHGLQYTPEELETALTSNGITILKNSSSAVSEDLVLYGFEDLSESKDRPSDYPDEINKDAFLVVTDHQPSKFKTNAGMGADLQLSGHTHAGQLFPLRFFYSIAGYVYDEYDYNGSYLLVSSGACGWRMPFRTDAHCNYEVITLKSE